MRGAKKCQKPDEKSDEWTKRSEREDALLFLALQNNKKMTGLFAINLPTGDLSAARRGQLLFLHSTRN